MPRLSRSRPSTTSKPRPRSALATSAASFAGFVSGVALRYLLLPITSATRISRGAGDAAGAEGGAAATTGGGADVTDGAGCWRGTGGDDGAGAAAMAGVGTGGAGAAAFGAGAATAI